MSNNSQNKVCAVIGASQAGVTFAFALRSEGWEGEIILFDTDTTLPYYRPPLSKTILTGEDSIDDHILKPTSLYEQEKITLKLGYKVESIDREKSILSLNDGNIQHYNKLVLATGSRPIIPIIKGINDVKNMFTLRTAEDVKLINGALNKSKKKRVLIIGGGYVGLETAASLKKTGASVTVLERENRVLARVTVLAMSEYFQKLHTENDVTICTGKNVVGFDQGIDKTIVRCEDGEKFNADLIIVGVGVSVNKELAENAGLEIENGIKVNGTSQTSDENIYAIGDCTFHYNPYYNRFIRLESIQNANDQAKVAAAAICGSNNTYNALPWFWSDQYGVKLQMVGLYQGANEILVRKDGEGNHKFSVWYFKNDSLLAVDAVNNTKAYVMGTKFIKSGSKISKSNLTNSKIEFKPANLLVE